MKKKRDKRYSAFTNEEMILRDHLAVDRTELANDRTFLAVVRTSLALFVAGVSIVHLLTGLLWYVLGWLLIAGGLVTFAMGYRHYRRVKDILRHVQ